MISGFIYAIVGCVVPCATLAAVLSMSVAMRQGARPGKWLLLKMSVATFFVFHMLLSLSHTLAGIYVISCYIVGIGFFMWCYREKRRFDLDR